MPLRVTALQLRARFDRKAEALDAARALVAEAPTDLVLFPEASLTGYVSPDGDFDLSAFAETLEGPTVRAIEGLAREASAYVAAPLVERSDGALFNAFVIVDRTGKRIAHYRKRHPWYPETWATPGSDPHPRFSIDGIRATLAICFDAHFLRDEARGAMAECDLLLFPSAWVEDVDTRPVMLAELAKEHGIAIVNANWARGDVAVRGQGGSLIVDAHGAVVATAGVGEARIDAALD